MTAELFRELFQACAAGSFALLLVAALRSPLRRQFGSQATYATWLLVPLATVAVWLPAANRVASDGVVAITLSQPLALAAHAAGNDSTDLRPWLLSIWAVGAVLTAALFVVRQQRFNRLIQRQPDHAYDIITGHGPAVVGWWRSRIVLPADFQERYSVHEQQLVLAHEQAHLSRGDIHAQTLATGLRCLLWFNPLVHYAAGWFRFDQELACDATVLAQFPSQRRRYGDAMLKTQLAEFGLPVGCHWQASHPLKERVAMLKQPLPGPSRRLTGLLLTLCLTLAGSYAAWAAQPPNPVKSTPAASPPWLTTITSDDDLTPPVYPADAKAKGLSGKVVLELLVGVDGKVKQVKLVSSEGGSGFEQASISAARKWKIHPATKDGKPVQGWVRVPVEFKPDSAQDEPQDKATPAVGRALAGIPSEAATTATFTLSPGSDGLRSRIGSTEVQSAPAVLDDASRTLPHYPADALARKLGGLVILNVLIDDRGSARKILIERSEPAGVFDQAAIEAMRRWKYQPGGKDGKPAQYWLRIPVRFDPA